MQELQTEKLQPIKLSPLPKNPLASVLIANYNYAKYIGEAIESVLNQTYQNFEVIVCDDGSTDNSCEVIETYVHKDSRVKLIKKPNGGVASTLNTLYQESKGEIICLLDADDAWIDNKLQKVVENFQAHPSGGFAIHNVFQIDGNGSLIKPTPMLEKLASGWMASSALENGGCVNDIPPASALCIRREVAELIFPLNEAFTRNADSLIFRFAPFVTKIVAVPEVLSNFRLHGANLTSFSNFTVNVLERELNTAERVHHEQEKFLKKVYGAEVAKNFRGIEANVWTFHDQYLLARLKSSPKSERKKVHQQLITHPQYHKVFTPHPATWLMQLGEYLPNFLFMAVFRQVYQESELKRLGRIIIKGFRIFRNK